ncbi:MAG: hypothetical protein Q8898_08545, partial [Bacillota bacterium]|nr:hypothetical protein [Bacillota bacterium]
ASIYPRLKLKYPLLALKGKLKSQAIAWLGIRMNGFSGYRRTTASKHQISIPKPASFKKTNLIIKNPRGVRWAHQYFCYMKNREYA